MTSEGDVLVESKTAEAAHAAAVSKEADINAHDAIMQDRLVKAFKAALTDDDSEQRPLLIRRIPFICNDIRWIKTLLWALLTANGFALLGIFTLALQRAFS